MTKQSIPEPRSKFLVVKCECNKEQIIFSHATYDVKCEVCGKKLIETTGGRAQILGEVLQVLQ